MKIYAKQVAPEYQESPLFLDDFFPDDIAVCGNRDFKERCPEVFQRVREVLENGELAEALEDVKTGGYYSEWYKNATQAINDLLPADKAKYSTKDIHELKRLVTEYAECSRSDEDSILCAVLSIVTGETWDYKQICGCCQGDWNNIFYPVDKWSVEALNAFEVEYFNTGTEWIVDDGEFDPENDSPLNINGCSTYCTEWNEDGIKREIADAFGGSPEDVVLYAFEGWSKIPNYREVG